MSEAAGLGGRVIRVTSRQPRRYRAGLEFTRTPRDLTPAELGVGLAAIFALVMICEDPVLSVVLVDGENEAPVGEAELVELRAWLEAEQLRADPLNPPALVAELQSESDAQSHPADAVFNGLDAAPSTDTAPASIEPAGEETASPAAEAAPSEKPKRSKS